MNVFQNLVDELKGENLLEETVIETNPHPEEIEEPGRDAPGYALYAEPDESTDNFEQKREIYENSEQNPEIYENPGHYRTEQENDLISGNSFDVAEQFAGHEQKTEAVPDADDNDVSAPKPRMNYPVQPTPLENKAEFYRKRAVDEVSGLQMVEHVLSGVEREQMKIVPKTYDDLEVKKVLHRFLQVANDLASPEHAPLEFQLMQETESWYSALSHRDKHVSVAHLRRFCETTRPVLSSQALISLARFYRNSPYSEQVRSKFDLILTRLFAKDIEGDRRKLGFTREELIQHLTALYADWASIPMYTANEDEDSEILIITLKFEDFMMEASNADSFDELIKNDFFNRLRVFKKSTNENFFAPLVVATAIECNVRVGNRYVDLLQQEKEKLNESMLEDKYGFLHDQAISEATGKTLQLLELLKDEEEIAEPSTEEMAPREKTQREKTAEVKNGRQKKDWKKGLLELKVNKWLLAVTILTFVLSIGLYIWANSAKDDAPASTVKQYSLETSFLKDYLSEARIGNDTFFGFVNPTWTVLEKQKKEDLLKRIREIGREQGYTKVQLIDERGQTVGFATDQKLVIF